MSSTARFIVAVIAASALAVLAMPELSSKLPAGTSQILTMAIAAALHRMNAEPLPPATPAAPAVIASAPAPVAGAS